MNVAFFIYRRPDLTARVFEAIAAARPERLLVVADGPRDEAERERCERTRAVVERVDWPCDVRRDYAPANLGCKRRIVSGLAWVFGQVEEAVILEDDCLPHPTLFPFCAELLERFRDDPSVGQISGSSFQRGRPRGPHSYYFSAYSTVWGWATWRRSWQGYDVAMPGWLALRDGGGLARLFPTPEEAAYFAEDWENLYRGRIDTWDGQWAFCQRTRGLCSVVPAVNLITNIGFRADATHTVDPRRGYAGLPVEPMTFPLRHPPEQGCDRAADLHYARQFFLRPRPLAARLLGRLSNRHWYGALLRRLPVLGPLWARLRGRKKGAG